MRKYKILQFPIRNTKSGVTQYVMNNREHIDKSRFQFDFATLDKTLDYAEILTEQGCKVHYISCYAEDDPATFISEVNVILDNGYDAVHLHTSFWRSFAIEEIAIARKVPVIIVHSHNSGIGGAAANINREAALDLHNRRKAEFSVDLATHFCACSTKAADWLFGPQISRENIQILKNAIDVEKFAYNKDIRTKYRRELGLDDSFVIGNIGRFEYQKNHDFLIDVFAEVSKKVINAKLLLVGIGDLMNNIKEKVDRLKLTDKVLFLGKRSDAAELYQAMDVFALTSRFEGLGMALIEAQCSGLKTYNNIENNIPENTITENIIGLPLDVEIWTSEIISIAQSGYDRLDHTAQVVAAGYSIKEQIKILEQIYAMENNYV